MRRPRIYEPMDTVLLLAAILLSAATLGHLADDWLGMDEQADAGVDIAVPPPLPDLCRVFSPVLRDDLVPRGRIGEQVLDRNTSVCGWRAKGRLLTVEIVRMPSVDEAKRQVPHQGDPVTGLGDEAFAHPDGGIVQVIVRQGMLVARVSYSGSQTDAQRVVRELLRLARP